jgi:hypothetical protein
MTSASIRFGRPVRVLLLQPAQWFASLAAALAARLHQLDGWLSFTQTTEPSTVEEVLAWAHRVEATQPGFAADLRAAALRSQGVDLP